jgi:AAA domain
MTFMSARRLAVNEVFTPRKTDVNREVYVERPELEKELKRALTGSLHTIIYGESGCGKSWLYKKVLADLDAYSLTANCANAVRFGSLTEEVKQVVSFEVPRRLSELSEEKTAAVKALVAEGGLTTTRNYQFQELDPLLECFRFMRDAAGRGLSVLVIENLEMIFSSDKLMAELASVITLLDDKRYAQFEIKLLIVGVPSGVKEFFLRTHASVANRVAEMSEVSSLTHEQVAKLVHKGFIDLLKVRIEEETLQRWQDHVSHVTMGFAQHVQEYCEQLGYLVEDAGWVGSDAHLHEADAQWLKRGLSEASVLIASWMNERETKIGRRNQVLYVLGKIDKRVFSINEIETMLRTEFPKSTADTTLAVGQILGELANGGKPIIKRSAKGSSYEFKDTRFAMALRVLLEKDPNRETVAKLE